VPLRFLHPKELRQRRHGRLRAVTSGVLPKGMLRRHTHEVPEKMSWFPPTLAQARGG
jgi:hypothetical protein